VMEIAEVYVINKGDRPGADKLQQELAIMLGMRRGSTFAHVPAHHGRPTSSPGPSDVWEPPVLTTIATQGEGVAELAAALTRHRDYLAATGKLTERRGRRLEARTRAVVNRAVRQWVWEETGAAELLARGGSPYEVAAEVLNQVRRGGR